MLSARFGIQLLRLRRRAALFAQAQHLQLARDLGALALAQRDAVADAQFARALGRLAVDLTRPLSMKSTASARVL